MGSIRGLLWDVDGTLCETGDSHRAAFNQSFADFGLPWHWSDQRYAELLAIGDGHERLMREMSTRPDAPVRAAVRDALAHQLQARKDERFAESLAARPIALRGGVAALIEECLARGVALGIATATSRSNLDVLLGRHWGDDWTRWFDAVVCGEGVHLRKPDPECYVRALLALRLTPREVIAVEDSPAGVAAARAVDLPVLVTRGLHFRQANFRGAVAVGPGLDQRSGWQPTLDRCAGSVGRVELADIAAWAARADEGRLARQESA